MEFAVKTEDLISNHAFPKIPLPILSEMDELKSIELGKKTMENIEPVEQPFFRCGARYNHIKIVQSKSRTNP